ncbi:MAG: hypothetical protein KKA79_04585 [Nanoarchaeota archaeon]|nr:hypothetical protein [Nanoarchaeota archaeon]MCG2718955.1 hypothetical protein [Nanoarchaeota archaeon]
MPINICIEALLRLFFEIIRVLFGDITLLWRGGYFETQLPALISTFKWIFLFAIMTVLVQNRLIRKALIVMIPEFINLMIDLLGIIPFIGPFLSIGAGVIGAPIAALAWAFALWTDEHVHPMLRLFATPGVMILAAVNAIHPFSIFGGAAYVVAFTFAAEIMAFLCIGLIGLIIILSPTFLCNFINGALKTWEEIRYEGWKAAIFGSFMLVKNKAIYLRNKF